MAFEHVHGFHFYQQHLLKVMLAARPLDIQSEVGPYCPASLQSLHQQAPHDTQQGFKLTLPRPTTSAFAPPAASSHFKKKVRGSSLAHHTLQRAASQPDACISSFKAL